VHSVDRTDVLTVLQKEAARADRTIDILLQVHISQEETKAGFSPQEVLGLCAVNVLSEYPNLRVVGLMGMASFTEDRDQVRREFSLLAGLYRGAQEQLGVGQITVLSMGMSGDYDLALAEGGNHIRVGSLLFGPRNQ
jgi:uncharacterized pyridoxal phosphate-containing UPF0001 family protein